MDAPVYTPDMRDLTFPPAGGRSLAALAWVLLLLIVGGCERETTPPLIVVDSVSPREIEQGDRLTITGTGFPEGKVAHVTFRGDLHRPALPPVRGALVNVNAAVTSPHEIEIPWTPSLDAMFVGVGEHASHTTFSGEITVAFSALSPASPPVAGTLAETWIDVMAPDRLAFRPDAREAQKTVAFLGIKPVEAPVAAGGVAIDSIRAGSPADVARLLPGDVITEIDGVRVLSLTDLVTAPGARSAWLRIRRAGSANEEPACVSLLGLSPPPAALLLGPVVVLAGTLLLLLLLFAPLPDAFAWLGLRLQRRKPVLAAARDSLMASAGSGAAAVSLLVSSSILVMWVPLSHHVGAGEIDTGTLFLLSVTALATLAFVAGGDRGAFLAGVEETGRVVSLAIPIASAIVAAVLLTGSLRIDDIVRAQAGAPWGWSLFRDPPVLILFGVSLVSLLMLGDTPEGPLPDADVPSGGARRREGDARGRLFVVARGGYVVVMCAVLAALFLGGWQLPGLAPEQIEGRLAWTLLGAAAYALKTWTLVLTVMTARRVLPKLDGARAMPLCWRWLVPVSIAGALLTAVWVAWRPSPGAETLVGAVSLAVTIAVVARVLGWITPKAPILAPELDPFL